MPVAERRVGCNAVVRLGLGGGRGEGERDEDDEQAAHERRVCCHRPEPVQKILRLSSSSPEPYSRRLPEEPLS